MAVLVDSDGERDSDDNSALIESKDCNVAADAGFEVASALNVRGFDSHES